MLKTSGLTSSISDKQVVFDLLRSYTSLAAFDTMMELYFDMRKQVLVTYNNTHPKTYTIATDEQFIETARLRRLFFQSCRTANRRDDRSTPDHL